MLTEGFSQGGREVELLRHAGDIVVELRPDGRLVYVSPAVEKILGRPASYFTDLSFLEVVVPADRQPTLAAFRKVVDTGDEPLLRFRCHHRDGHPVEFEATARSFVDDEGRKRVVVVCRDLTEQSIQVAAHRARDAYHRAIAESGSRAAVITTIDGDIHFSNRRFREIFGNCTNISEIRKRMTEESRSSVNASWYHTRQNEQLSAGNTDFEYTRSDGTTAWFSSTWEPIFQESTTRQFSMLFLDITRRKKIEQALRLIAQGLTTEGTDSFRPILSMIAEALEFDRIVLGLVAADNTDNTNDADNAADDAADDADQLNVLAAWQDGVFLADESLALEGLPDRDVANGETCIHPAALGQLMPPVAERIGHDFESYAGMPLRRTDGSVLGIIGGYSRKSIEDTDLVRSILLSFAILAASAIDRLRADEEVQANRARFDALALQAQDMLVEVDSTARITYMSPASKAVLGRDPETFIGLDVGELTHPDDLPNAEQAIEQLKSGQRNAGAVTRGRHIDGSWRWIESRTSSFKCSDGSFRTLIVARDVTERHRGELGRDLLFSVVQNGADLVFVCETDTALLFANKAAMKLMAGPDNQAVEGMRFTDLLAESDGRRLENEVLPSLTLSTPWSGELELRGSGDENQPIAVEATIYLFPGTKESAGTYLAITLRDISDRRKAQEALQQSESRLSQAQKMEAVGRLAGGIAHDFNNLLTAIIGYSDLVLDQLGEGHGSQRDVEEILRAAERAGGLTRQLLAFSRRQVLQSEAVDLNVIVADIDRMMRRLIGENIELVTSQDGELRPIIADPGQIEQVIVNLVVNARDAIPAGGRIDIETGNFHTPQPLATDSGRLEAGDYVVLRVSDTGVGIDEKVRSQIFEPFFTTKEANEGTGLGLASAYGIVSQSGGQIDVESSPQQGTTFSVYLPAAREQDPDMEHDFEEPDVGGTETILVVEDSQPVRDLVARTLESSGYTVLLAASATAALRHCSRHEGPIDLLLTDVVLPKIPGPEIARRALELRPTLRVLFMSGFTDDTLIRQGLDPERPALLEKPFAPSTVLSRVRRVLNGDPQALPESMFHGEHSQ